MFIDDSGEVCPQATNDPRFRYASITGVIFNLAYLRETFEPSFFKLKERHFGLTDKGRPPILHRRLFHKFDGPFAVLKHEDKKQKWWADCLRMYDIADYIVVTACVDKIAFYYHHPEFDGNFYKLLVFNAIERYFYYLKNEVDACGDIVVEALNKEHDGSISDYYHEAYKSGLQHIKAEVLRKRLSSNSIKIEPKKNDVAGLQMADLLAGPSRTNCRFVYQNVNEFSDTTREIAKILESKKYYRNKSGNPDRFGRVWRPQKS